MDLAAKASDPDTISFQIEGRVGNIIHAINMKCVSLPPSTDERAKAYNRRELLETIKQAAFEFQTWARKSLKDDRILEASAELDLLGCSIRGGLACPEMKAALQMTAYELFAGSMEEMAAQGKEKLRRHGCDEEEISERISDWRASIYSAFLARGNSPFSCIGGEATHFLNNPGKFYNLAS